MPSGKQTVMDDGLGFVSDRPAVSPARRWQRRPEGVTRNKRVDLLIPNVRVDT